MANDQFSEYSRNELVGLFSVVASSTGEWALDEADPNREARSLNLQLRLGEGFKNDNSTRSGAVFEINSVQARPASGRYAYNYGVWSDIDVTEGRQLIAFCEPPAAEEGGTQALTCNEVYNIGAPPVAHGVEDLRFISSAEKTDRDLAEVLSSGGFAEVLEKRKDPAGPILARWLRDLAANQTPDVMVETFAELVLRANGHASFYAELVTAMAETTSLYDDLSPVSRGAAVRAMLHVLKSTGPEYQPVQGPIAQAYLGNTIFGGGETALVERSHVFKTDDARGSAIKAVRDHTIDPTMQARLLRWLGAV